MRRHPDAVAAVHADRRVDLPRAQRPGQPARPRAAGPRAEPEGVVAVVTERNLDWMAAVIAIFKAGGVYLPIEPHLPGRPDRHHALPRRVLPSCSPSTAAPPPSTRRCARCPACRRVLIDVADAEGHPDGDLGVAVGPDQLAYIYFTSGSTGEPKGAMCEHAGMLNHLYAKIDDLEHRRGRGGRPDRPPVLRHLAVAAGLRAAGRRAHPADRAGGDPGRRPGSSTRSSRAGSGCSRWCRPTSRSCSPTCEQHPRARCRTCTACRSPARR